ncbi:MAG: TROVE domain-containing protein [Blastocatellia bacterium]|nr:TROVE domain-containing protein [Blastocatellia bacterium]
MANKNLFQSLIGQQIQAPNTLNQAGAPAYEFSPKHKLAQYAMTGCLNSTFYATAQDQLAVVLDLARQIEPEFIAKLAIYTRKQGFMKDMPALLCAVLAVKDRDLLAAIFPRVIDNGKMLRNFVQIIRSGQVGRKSLGTAPKRLVRQWFETRNDDMIFRDSVGQSPSFADIIKMVHPKPKEASREALFGYFIGRDHNAAALPQLVQQYEAFKAGNRVEIPNVPFQMLTALNLGTAEWTEIARNASWQMTRMNLNTFARHGVFNEAGLPELIATRLRNPQEIAKARVFPYQLMTAFLMAGNDVPQVVRLALQEAMEIALANVPELSGQVYVLPDVSGSMSCPATGYRPGATSTVRCIDVAALVAAAVVRKNTSAQVLPFEHSVVNLTLNPFDTVMTNAQKLASIGGGGTNCSAPLRKLNERKAAGDLIIYVSDNESWVDANGRGRGTATMQEWNVFKQRNPQARMVCIDIQPYGTTQAYERDDILNVGGFSDQVFDVIAKFAAGTLGADHWVGVIEAGTI